MNSPAGKSEYVTYCQAASVLTPPAIDMFPTLPVLPEQAAVQQSHVIDIAGTFAGAAIRLSRSYRFIAVNPRVFELDRSEYASLEAVRHAVHREFVARDAKDQSIFSKPRDNSQ